MGLGAAWLFGVADLYLAGRSAGALGGPVLTPPGVGVYFTLVDAIVLVAALLAAGITWTELRGHGA
jgi:hypothetical protein